jgi:hypothetical protein
MSKGWAIVVKTSDGYMVYDPCKEDYVHDSNGDNLFDSSFYAEDLRDTYNTGKYLKDLEPHDEIMLRLLAALQGTPQEDNGLKVDAVRYLLTKYDMATLGIYYHDTLKNEDR